MVKQSYDEALSAAYSDNYIVQNESPGPIAISHAYEDSGDDDRTFV
jgi:hypothetical protein